jgi:transcriptional regulator with XRE-family HTH domain
MFPNLKLQIFRRGAHQNQLARKLGIDETVLSKIIHGYRNPTVSQRKLLAGYLEVDEDWLFEPFDVASLTRLELGTLDVGKDPGNNEDSGDV